MTRIRCSDYDIVKIRTYANESLLKNRDWQNNKYARTQHHYRAVSFNALCWKLIEYLIEQKRDECYRMYGTSALDCMFDQLEQEFGIIRLEREGWNVIMIPKHWPWNSHPYSRLTEWIQEYDLPYKLIQKTQIGYRNRSKEDLEWRREHFKKQQEEILSRVLGSE